MRRYAIPSIATALLAAIAAALFLLNAAAGTEAPPNEFAAWPPFVAVFETEGRAATYGDTIVDTGRIKRRLTWNSRDDWKVITIEGPTIDAGRPETEVGSYESLHGRTYTVYDNWLGATITEELPENHYRVPANLFSELLVYSTGVAARTDGRPVLMDIDYCDGDCDINGPRSLEPAYLSAQQFGDLRVIFTDDDYLIPLRSGETEVLELHLNYPTPTPTPTATPTPTPTATPAPTPYAGGGNPRAESVTGTTVTVSWDRLGSLPRPGSATDYRVNYRRSASDPWTFGNYVTSESFGHRRPQTTVPRTGALTCNTEYEFQVQAQIFQQGDAWRDYGTFTASTRAC